jgi:hypothetical protein
VSDLNIEALRAQYENLTRELVSLQSDVAEFARLRRAALLGLVEARGERGDKVHYSDFGLSKQTFSALLKKAREESGGD